MSGEKGSMSSIAVDAVEAAWRVVPKPLRDLVDGTAAADREMTGVDKVQGATDMANELASVLARFVTQIAKDVASAAGELGEVVSKHPTVGAITEPLRSAVKAAAEPPSHILVLPDASPGQTTSVPVEVRNDSLQTYDAVRLRCFMLLGPGGTSIAGHNVSFSPASIDIAANTTATVVCQVTVPSDATRAQYQGLIDAIGIAGVQLMVGLHVI